PYAWPLAKPKALPLLTWMAQPILAAVPDPHDQDVARLNDEVDDDVGSARIDAHRRRQLDPLTRQPGKRRQQLAGLPQLFGIDLGLRLAKEPRALDIDVDQILL